MVGSPLFFDYGREANGWARAKRRLYGARQTYQCVHSGRGIAKFVLIVPNSDGFFTSPLNTPARSVFFYLKAVHRCVSSGSVAVPGGG